MIKYYTFHVSFITTESKRTKYKMYTKGSRGERDPVNQKERSGTMKLGLVGLLAQIGSILRGWFHFGPSLGI